MESLYKNRPRPAGPRRAYQRLEWAFLCVGFACLLWVGLTLGKAWLYQSYQSYRFEQQLAGGSLSGWDYLKWLTGLAAPAERTAQAPDNKPQSPVTKVGRDGLIGRIEIPRVKVSAIIREGVDDGTLSQAVGHVPYTALPGNPGNVGVAAHRDTFFRGLRNAKLGDEIRIVTTAGTYTYSIDSTEVVKPENVEVLDPTPQPYLTLVTCYPFNYVGSAPYRYIVKAKQQSITSQSASESQLIEASTKHPPSKVRAVPGQRRSSPNRPVAQERRSPQKALDEVD